jgi:hypothetical protein
MPGVRARAPLVVHHRAQRNEAKLLVTLCAGCHMRLHHSYGFRHWLSGTLLRLWREIASVRSGAAPAADEKYRQKEQLGGVPGKSEGNQNACSSKSGMATGDANNSLL